MAAVARAEADLKVARAEAAALVARAEAAALVARAEAAVFRAKAGLPPITEFDAVVTPVKDSEQERKKQWKLDQEKREREAEWDKEDPSWRWRQS